MGIFSTIFWEPIYNFFIAIINLTGSIPIFLLITPIILSAITFPLIAQSSKVGILQKKAQVEINEIRTKYKTEQQVQAQKLLELYKRKGIKPFSSLFATLLSLIILIISSLIIIQDQIFDIREDLLYSFVSIPENINQYLFSIDLSEKSITLILFAALMQYLLINETMKIADTDPPEGRKIKEKIGKYLKVFVPVITGVSAFFFSGAVAAYWGVTALVALLRELFILKPLKDKWNKEE